MINQKYMAIYIYESILFGGSAETWNVNNSKEPLQFSFLGTKGHSLAWITCQRFYWYTHFTP